MLKQYRKKEIINNILDNLKQNFGIDDISKADYNQIYHACAKYIQSELYEIMLKTEKAQKLEQEIIRQKSFAFILKVQRILNFCSHLDGESFGELQIERIMT